MPISDTTRISTFSFRFYAAGDELVECPYATPWRSVPCLVFNQWSVPLAVEEPGRSTHIVPANHGILWLAGQRHRLSPVCEQGQVRCRWVHIQYQWMESIDPFLNWRLPPILKIAQANRLAASCVRLAADGVVNDPAAIAGRHVEAFRILQMLLGWSQENLLDAINGFAPIAPAMRFIHENLHRPFTRAELARTMELSEGRFHEVFARQVGIAPMSYVAQQRLHLAQRLLATSSEKVSVVAQRCGFNDVFHFSRRFKSFSGLSPSHYREAAVIWMNPHGTGTAAPGGATRP